MQISVPPALNTANSPSCTGIFQSVQAEPGPVVRDIGVTFQQVDTATASQLYTYPPLLYFRNTPRFRVENVICAVATICIDMRGGSGGAYIDNLQFSALNKGIWIDGAQDTVRIRRPHWYPVNLTANQLSIANAQAIGIYSGRMDDLDLSDGLFIMNQGMSTFTGATGPTFGNITNTDFDTYGGIAQYGGTLTCASCTFTVGPDSGGTAFYALYAAAGQFTCSACNFGSGGASHALVYMPNGSTANVTLNGPVFNMGAFDQPTIQQFSSTLAVTGMQVFKAPNTTYNQHVVDIEGGRLIASGDFISDHGSGGGTGQGIYVKSDADNRVIGNVAPGWSCTVNGSAMPSSLTPVSGGGVYIAPC